MLWSQSYLTKDKTLFLLIDVNYWFSLSSRLVQRAAGNMILFGIMWHHSRSKQHGTAFNVMFPVLHFIFLHYLAYLVTYPIYIYTYIVWSFIEYIILHVFHILYDLGLFYIFFYDKHLNHTLSRLFSWGYLLIGYFVYHIIRYDGNLMGTIWVKTTSLPMSWHTIVSRWVPENLGHGAFRGWLKNHTLQ